MLNMCAFHIPVQLIIEAALTKMLACAHNQKAVLNQTGKSHDAMFGLGRRTLCSANNYCIIKVPQNDKVSVQLTELNIFSSSFEDSKLIEKALFGSSVGFEGRLNGDLGFSAWEQLTGIVLCSRVPVSDPETEAPKWNFACF